MHVGSLELALSIQNRKYAFVRLRHNIVQSVLHIGTFLRLLTIVQVHLYGLSLSLRTVNQRHADLRWVRQVIEG